MGVLMCRNNQQSK